MPAHADTSSLQYLRPEVQELKNILDRFVNNECIPAEKEYEAHMRNRYGSERWTVDAVPPCLNRLKARAKELGLWNIFLPIKHVPTVRRIAPELAPKIVLTYREYGIFCESLGRCPDLAPQACNSSAPDTGNMEVLIEFGTLQQQQMYLIPLLRGEIRSTFLMTEPNVASSDPTNLETKLTKIILSNGEVEYELSGHKWWSTGAMDPRCRLGLVVAKMDFSHPSCTASANINNSKHGAHTIVIIPIPHKGLRLKRALTVFGYDDAPFGHAEVVFEGVKLTPASLILGEGSGFQVSQARLGPGRIHHCMRGIGMGTYENLIFVDQTFSNPQ
jgi:acyl-CoA dehydrogenase